MGETKTIQNPGPFRITPTVKAAFGACTVIGIITFLTAMKVSPGRAWPNFLINFFFFTAISLFGGFFVALQHITNAYWSVTVRRLAEALLSFLPVAFLLALVLFWGRHELYEWTHTHVVQEDAILSGKAPYLNGSFFLVRILVFFGLWMLLGFKMRKNSLDQDQSGDHKYTLQNIKLACAFIPVFGICFTLASFDWIMSLEPHWFSTIFGVYCFAGLFFSGLCMLVYLTITARQQGLLTSDIVNENHIHDIGKLMFGFTVFWAYIMFSQLMLQWYANLPEEIPYYLRRFHGSWWYVCIALFLVHFIIPFFMLLPRGNKRNDKFLKKMAVFMLLAQWLDVYMLVMPVFFKDGPVFGWVEGGVFLGFLGLFGISVGSFLQKVPAVPLKDPRLEQCLVHTQ